MQVWSFEVAADSHGMWEDVTDEQIGEVPCARSVFGATTIAEDEIFLYGGEVEASTAGHEGAGLFRSDAYVLRGIYIPIKSLN